MLRKALISLVALCAMGSTSAMAADPHLLPPTSPWHLNYFEDSCALARTFGAGDEAVSLYLEQFSPGPFYEAKLIGKPFRWGQLRAPTGLGLNDGPLMTVMSLSGKTGDNSPFVSFRVAIAQSWDDLGGRSHPMTNDDKRGMATDVSSTFAILPATELREIRVRAPARNTPLVLETGSLSKAMEAMKTCMNRLVVGWGLDPEVQRTLTRKAKPLNGAEWITSKDYPKTALNKDESAVVNLRLIVTSTGQVRDCVVQRATQGDEFKKRTCELVAQRARFEPALDSVGKPVDSYYVGTVKWLMAINESGATSTRS